MKVKHTKVKIGNPPFEYTTSEEAAPDKLAYANNVGLGKIIKKSATKKNVPGGKIIVTTVANATSIHKPILVRSASVAKKSVMNHTPKRKKKRLQKSQR